MKRDFAKKHFEVDSAGILRWRRLLFACIIVVLCCGIVFFIHQQRKNIANASMVSDYFAKIKTWIVERKNHLHQDLAKAKDVVTNKNNAEPQIHFEFYTTLPNMQMTVPEPAAKNDHVITVAEKSEVQEITAKPVKKSVPAKTAAPTSIVNAEELEKEFAKQIKPANTNFSYAVQTGVFKNFLMAEKHQKTLADAGFSAGVIPVPVAGKEMYHVQVGPFSNKNQAKNAQLQLQKKGITGVVRKVTSPVLS